ncbi:MAG: hypothetical protein ACFCUJ_16790 [Thiotrichales bacterium]
MTGTVWSAKPKSDPLSRRDDAPGYRVAWKKKYYFERGAFPEEMSYAEARKKCEALQRTEPDKVFWPELIYG